MVFDRSAALERVGGDETLLKEIAALFLSDYPQIVDEIYRALEVQDARQLERAAHNLKGAAANFGAVPVVAAALELEQAGRRAQLGAAAQAVRRLEEQLQTLHAALAGLID